MGSASKTDTSPVRKLTDESTEFSLGKRKFCLNEMKIGRTKKFISLINDTFERLRSSYLSVVDGKDFQQLQISEVINDYGDEAFEEIARLFNFCFEYRNDDYEPIDAEWISDNLSVREMGMLLQEILKMNKLEWLLPFFRDQFFAELNKIVEQA